MVRELNFKTTAELAVDKKIINQVIGQDKAVEIVKKAAKQKRNVLLIGEPGTGKSMIGQALAELLSKEKLVDILSMPNPKDEDKPLVKTVPAGDGNKLRNKLKMASMAKSRDSSFYIIIVLLIILNGVSLLFDFLARNESDVLQAANRISGTIMTIALLVIFMLYIAGYQLRKQQFKILLPKVIVDNGDSSTAPFIDATGSHEGALLGDIKHDPFQCFSSSTAINLKSKNFEGKAMIREFVDSLLNNSNSIERNDYGYEAVFLPQGEYQTIGVKDGIQSIVDILSVNKREYAGKLLSICLGEGGLTVTPTHKLAVYKNGSFHYVEAQNVKVGDEIIMFSDVVLCEEDIVKTFSNKDQEQVNLYKEFLKIKQENPSFGYKKIARVMGVSYNKLRWWNSNIRPKPLLTIDWLRERNLLPLKLDDRRISIIARVLGCTFGDGGIFYNLNGIFLSSKEKESLEEFRKDLISIFGEEIEKNFDLREGGEKGHSWCLRNSNRRVVRFFVALGAPVGNKSMQELKIPSWIKLNTMFEQEFYGSLLGGELGSPKMHKQMNRLNTLDFAISGFKEFHENRINFLKELQNFLRYNNIETTSIAVRKLDNRRNLYRLLFSIKLDNVIRFVKDIKINYCYYKSSKLIKAVNEFSNLKREKYYELLERGYGAETCMKLLNLTPETLFLILNKEGDLIEIQNA